MSPKRVPLLLAVISTFGCEPTKTCELVGCISGVTAVAPWIGKADRFDVAIQGEGLNGSFTCELDPAVPGGSAYRLLAAEATGEFAVG